MLSKGSLLQIIFIYRSCHNSCANQSLPKSIKELLISCSNMEKKFLLSCSQQNKPFIIGKCWVREVFQSIPSPFFFLLFPVLVSTLPRSRYFPLLIFNFLNTKTFSRNVAQLRSVKHPGLLCLLWLFERCLPLNWSSKWRLSVCLSNRTNLNWQL